MTSTNAAPQERTDLDARDVRALTDYLLVVEEAPGLFLVYGEDGDEYTVDADTGACTCPDAEYRYPEGGCKHARRVAFHTGAREVPEWINHNAMDPLLVKQLADSKAPDVSPEQEVATDGGAVVDDEEATLHDEDSGDRYTEHVEPPSQGGEPYVRCVSCGWELLISLGGWDALTHAEGCPSSQQPFQSDDDD